MTAWKAALLGSLVLVLSLALATDAAAALSASQRACVASQTGSLRRLVAAENRTLLSCMRDYAAGLVGQSTVQSCITNRRDDVTRRVATATTSGGKACAGAALPPILVADVPTLAFAAALQRREIYAALFGLWQPVRAADRPASSRCQMVATRRLVTCARARLAVFDQCERKALREGGGIDEVSACVAADPRGRIARACGKVGGPDPLYDELHACGQALYGMFPVCGTEGGAFDTARCLLKRHACSSCRTLNVARDLQGNCDLLDDQQDNLSCGCGDTIVTPAEQCDDGNQVSGDGCTATCRIESDTDLDDIDDAIDNCPSVANADQADRDRDRVGDVCDSCPTVENADQDPAACGCHCFTTEDIDAQVGVDVAECYQRITYAEFFPLLTTYIRLTDGRIFSSGWAEFDDNPEFTYGLCATWPPEYRLLFVGIGGSTIAKACAAETTASQAWITHGCPIN